MPLEKLSKRKEKVIGLLLKVNIAATAAIMFITTKAFSDAPAIGDPITGSFRPVWAFAGFLGLTAAVQGLISDRKVIRFLSLAVGAAVILALGTTYLIVLPISSGIWFILVLGVSLLSSAGIVYFLPSNLRTLIDLNEGLTELEKEVAAIRDKISHEG